MENGFDVADQQLEGLLALFGLHHTTVIVLGEYLYLSCQSIDAFRDGVILAVIVGHVFAFVFVFVISAIFFHIGGAVTLGPPTLAVE